MKKRLLVIDEAWYFMQHPDSAKFIYSMTKRARKYYLGITTITQDVEDFLHNDYGKAIVSNASIQFLMKQSTASIPVLADTFYLSEGERQLLVSSDIGEGIFFAGHNHVALRVVASQEEHEVITSDPAELMARRSQQNLNTPEEQAAAEAAASSPAGPPTYQNQQEHQPSQQEQTTQQQMEPDAESGVDKEETAKQTFGESDENQMSSDLVKQQANQTSRRKGHYTIEDYQRPSDGQE
jgi:hypothetical protein